MFDNFRINLSAANAFIEGASQDHINFIKSNFRCSKCDTRLLTNKSNISANFYSKGKPVIFRAIPLLQRDIVLECTNCGYQWNMYGESNLIRPNNFVNIIQGDITEIFIGSESRTIDNLDSTSQVERELTFSKEWSKNYSIEYERTLINGVEFSLGSKLPVTEFASIKSTSQETLKKRYTIVENKKETVTEKFKIIVPGLKKVKVELKWKNYLQLGVIKLCDQNDMEFELPFKVIVGLTFDQSQTDLS